MVGRFVGDGLALGEAVLLAVPARDAGVAARRVVRRRRDCPADVRMVDITEVARNPSRFMAMESAFIDEYPDRRVRIVSQLAWPGRTDEEFSPAWNTRHWSTRLWTLPARPACASTTRAGSTAMCWRMRARHTRCCGNTVLPHRSADYAPDDVLARCNQPLAAGPGAVTYTVRKTADLRSARSFAVDYAGWIGLSQDSIEDLQLVATELATNSLMYTWGVCRLAFWQDDGIWSARHATPDDSTTQWWALEPRPARYRESRSVSGQRHRRLGANPHHQDRYDDPGVSTVRARAGTGGVDGGSAAVADVSERAQHDRHAVHRHRHAAVVPARAGSPGRAARADTGAAAGA